MKKIEILTWYQDTEGKRELWNYAIEFWSSLNINKKIHMWIIQFREDTSCTQITVKH